MPNSLVAALVHPVLHGIRIPIHQTKQREGKPHTRPHRHKDSVAFAMWLSTAVGTTTSPGSKLKKAGLAIVELFYVCRKVKILVISRQLSAAQR